MKILVIYRVNEHSKKLSGVFHKFIGQLEALEATGCHVYALYMSRSSQCLSMYSERTLSVLHQWKGVPADDEKRHFWQNAIDAVQLCKPDSLYTRYDKMLYAADILGFFRQVASVKGLVKNLEFPTYPYDQENKDKQAVEYDAQCREQLTAVVDHVFSTSHLSSIIDKPNHFFTNQLSGRQMDDVNDARSPIPLKPIQLVSVANITECHGFDRLIRGIHEYVSAQPMQRRTIRYTLIGDGDYVDTLKALTKQCQLEDIVEFAGYKNAQELQEEYSRASIGVASLALHRKNLTSSSALKVREYLANGLPICIAGHDPVLENFTYKIVYKEDESSIDVAALVNFARHLNTLLDVRTQIRQYAHENVSWLPWANDVRSKKAP